MKHGFLKRIWLLGLVSLLLVSCGPIQQRLADGTEVAAGRQVNLPFSGGEPAGDALENGSGGGDARWLLLGLHRGGADRRCRPRSGGSRLRGCHALAQLLEGELGDLLEGLENTVAVNRGRLVENVPPVRIEIAVELFDGEDVLQIPLVVLQDERQVRHLETEVLEVVDEAREALDVRLAHGSLRVCDEDEAIDSFEDQLSGRVVKDLAGHGVQLEAGLEAADGTDLDGEEVEEQGPI